MYVTTANTTITNKSTSHRTIYSNIDSDALLFIKILTQGVLEESIVKFTDISQ